jgi:hypothetical protein
MQVTMASFSSLRLCSRALEPVGAVVVAAALVPVGAVEVGGALGAESVETVVFAMEKLLHLQG